MARTIKAFSAEANRDRIEHVLARRQSNAAGPHGDRRRPRGGRQGARVALRREVTA